MKHTRPKPGKLHTNTRQSSGQISMRWLLSVAFTATLFIPNSRAADKDPLRFFPESTAVVLKVERPRTLVEAVLKHDLAREAQELQIVRDFLDSADFRRFFQLVAHFEKELGAPWPELIDKLAGGGAAVGLKIGSDNNAPALLALQGTDEKTVTKFFDLGLSIFEEELIRQGAKEKPKRKTYQGVEVVELSKDVLAARIGDALLLSNKGDTMKAALDQNAANQKDAKAKNLANNRATADAKKILPGDPLAWLCLNLKTVKELPQLKELFTTPRDNVILTFLFAGYLDVARRSDFAAAGFYHDKGDFRVAIRMPAGRDGMATDVELHLPRDPKVTGTLPLLEPKGVLFTHSFYLDLDTLYQKREAILPPQVAKDFAEQEKQISRFLIGTTLPKFLSQMGPHIRLVATQPEKVESYKTQPDQRLPAFGVVIEMRDPQFGKSLSAFIKGGLAALGQQVSTRSWEEEIAGLPTFGYSFPENGKFIDDPLKLRFNYQPTFVIVQNQFVAASNKGLAKELIEIIQKEDRSKLMTQNMQARAFSSGLGDYVYTSADQALAGTILAQGLKLGAAKEQTQALFGFLQKLGTVSIETDYTANEFRLDLHWRTKK
jgi:hypothetical protein